MKKLIYQDEKAIQNEIELRNKLNDLINEFMTYLTNKGVNPKKEHVISFIEHGTPFIHQLLLQDAKKEIKRLKINSVSIQNNMLTGIEKQAAEFQDILNRIIDQKNKCSISIEEVSFQENTPVISDTDINKIKECHSVYLKNEEQEKIWNLQVEFANAFNKFEDGLKEFGLSSSIYYGKPENIEDFLNFKLSKDAEYSGAGMEEVSGYPRNGGVIIEPNPDIHK